MPLAATSGAHACRGKSSGQRHHFSWLHPKCSRQPTVFQVLRFAHRLQRRVGTFWRARCEDGFELAGGTFNKHPAGSAFCAGQTRSPAILCRSNPQPRERRGV
eukprot:gene9713-biopygen22747